jgi:hypothetical protein
MVIASHPYTTTDTIPNVVVTSGTTTSGIDFVLIINRADMVCLAINLGAIYLNDVDVVIQGPEGPYAGTILNDSLVFLHVPYGFYTGTATYTQGGPVYSDTTIDAGNHHLIFNFLLEGISVNETNTGLQVIPNPAGARSMISFSVQKEGMVSFELYNARGLSTGELKRQYFGAGNHQVQLSLIRGSEKMVQGLYLLRMVGENSVRTCKIIYTGM